MVQRHQFLGVLGAPLVLQSSKHFDSVAVIEVHTHCRPWSYTSLESPGETSVGGQDFPLGKGRIWHRKEGSKSCISWVEKGLGSIESSEASLHLEVVVHLDLNIKDYPQL